MGAGTEIRNFSYGDDLVSLDVVECYGTAKNERFSIYLRHACKHSPVLRKAFVAEQKKAFVIRDSSPVAVGLLIDWIHTQQIHLTVHNARYSCSDNRPFARPTTKEVALRKAVACQEEAAGLVNLWILAGELLIPKLQNQTMTLLLKVARSCALTFAPLYTRVYRKTDVGSPLREFIARLCAWNENHHEFETRPHLFPPPMLLDLARIYCQSLPQAVAIARRNDLQRSYIELVVKEEYYGTDSTTQDSGSEDTPQKYSRSELSTPANGNGTSIRRAGHVEGRGTWTSTKKRGFRQPLGSMMNKVTVNLIDYSSPKKAKQSRESITRSQLRATDGDPFEASDWNAVANDFGVVLIPDVKEEAFGLNEDIQRDGKGNQNSPPMESSGDPFTHIWQSNEGVFVPNREDGGRGGQSIETLRDKQSRSTAATALSEDSFGLAEWGNDHNNGGTNYPNPRGNWLMAQDTETDRNTTNAVLSGAPVGAMEWQSSDDSDTSQEDLPNPPEVQENEQHSTESVLTATLGDSGDLLGLRESETLHHGITVPHSTVGDSSDDIFCAANGANIIKAKAKEHDSVVTHAPDEAFEDLLGPLDTGEVEVVAGHTCECMLVCVCRRS